MLPIKCARRALVVAYDICALTLIALLLTIGTPCVAYAYVDPSVMTYTIQALAGVAVALSAIAGVAFRRSRRAIMKALNIDENAKKERESAVQRVSFSEENAHRSAAFFQGEEEAVETARSKRDQGEDVREEQGTGTLRRVILSALVSLFVVITLFVIAPCEMLAGSESSLVFGLYDAWPLIMVFALVLTAMLTLVLSLLRGKAFNVALMVLFGFGLCCYVQALFLNEGLPTTDGRVSSWSGYAPIAVVSALVWVALIAAPLVLNRKNRNVAQITAGGVAAALVLVQGVAVFSLIAETVNLHQRADGAAPASSYVTTTQDMFTVSPEKNVVVFVLDTFDTTDMEYVLQADPEVAQELAGFTWFRNSVGSMSPTRYGAPFLLTGVYPSADESFEEFVSQRYTRSSYLGDIYDAGYSIGLYTDTLGDYAMTDEQRCGLIYDRTVNVVAPPEDQRPKLDVLGTLSVLAKSSCYRDLPWLVKPFAYFTTDEMNQAMVGSGNSDSALAPYVMDDAEWYKSLKKQGLSYESRESEGAFRYIHLVGTHIFYNIDENGEYIGENESTLEQQARGSMKMTLEYINQMKELGVYEDATIIITADHGIWWESEVGPLPWVSSPLMLVKPAGASTGDLKESDAEITAYDVLPTVIDAIGGDRSSYGPTVFEQSEEGRDRRYYLTFTKDDEDLAIVEYSIVGDVLDESNWSETGIVWDPSNTPRT